VIGENFGIPTSETYCHEAYVGICERHAPQDGSSGQDRRIGPPAPAAICCLSLALGPESAEIEEQTSPFQLCEKQRCDTQIPSKQIRERLLA
jgi:hypothetical protein